MKTKALPYLLLLLATNVFGQALQLSIAVEDTAAIFPVSHQVSALPSGGFISTTSRDVAGLTPIWTKHQADGSVVWHRALQREDTTFRFGVNRILALPDEGMIALLPRLDSTSREAGAVLLRLDATGGLLWSKLLPWYNEYLISASPDPVALLLTSPDRFLLCAVTYTPDGQSLIAVQQFSLDGELLNGHRVRTADYPRLTSPNFSLSAEQLQLSFYAFGSPTLDPGFAFLNFDLATNNIAQAVIWREDGLTIQDIQTDEQGQRYFSYNRSGAPSLAKASASGEWLWSITAGIAGNILLGPSTLRVVPSSGSMASFNTSDGSPNWRRQHAFVIPNSPFSRPVLLADGSIMGTGFRNPQTLIFRTAPDGDFPACPSLFDCNFQVSPTAPLPEPVPLPVALEPLMEEAPLAVSVEAVSATANPICLAMEWPAAFELDSTACANEVLTASAQPNEFETTSRWELPGALPASVSGAAATFRYEQPGVYEVRHIISLLGCQDTAVQQVTIDSAPDFTLGPDTSICEGQRLLLDSGLPDDGTALLWSDGSTAPTLLATQPGLYTLAALSSNGCTATDSLRLSFSPPPPLPQDTVLTFCEGKRATIALPASAGLIYGWSDGQSGPERDFSEPGRYALTLTNAQSGCQAQTAIQVLAQDCDPSLFAPNAFSPNGDGRNDRFQVYAPGLTVTRLQIFNRWGGLVFDQSGEAPAWDGTFLGQPAPTGLYVYRLTYTRLSDGTAGQEEGEVVLLR